MKIHDIQINLLALFGIIIKIRKAEEQKHYIPFGEFYRIILFFAVSGECVNKI